MKLERGIIVSCQAAEGEPLYGLGIMRYFAKAAVEGGAVGIRCLLDELPSIRDTVSVPIIGLVKRQYPDSEIYITPTVTEIDALIAAKPDVIALDATLRPRPNGETLADLVKYVRKVAPEIRLMADCAEIADVKNAVRLGFDYVSSTLRGYTAATKGKQIPDYDFLKEAKSGAGDRLIVEGGLWETGQLEKAAEVDPYAVVIGSSITRPHLITRRFVNAFAERENDRH